MLATAHTETHVLPPDGLAHCPVLVYLRVDDVEVHTHQEVA